MDRRRFIQRAGLATAAAVVATTPGCELDRGQRPPRTRPDDTRPSGDGTYASWQDVRAAFDLSAERIHMSALLVSSHPRPVRDAIERYRRELDADPVDAVGQDGRRKNASRQAAADYLGTSADQIALTDSTTEGLGLVYNGIHLEPGDEILTTEHDYYATHESVRLAAERSGATVRRIALFDHPAAATADEIASRLAEAITFRTRVVAITWVHSSTGMKLPVATIRSALEGAAGRLGAGMPLLALDGVHGFGVEDVQIEALGCDVFAAGCHKWLFGPRGTGIVWARSGAWAEMLPTIPTFDESAAWSAWARGNPPPGPTTARRMTPGGFKPFEHQWALAEAFRFHQAIGKDAVQERTHGLATQLKDGLAALDRVVLYTPRDPELSSGIVCFDVEGRSPESVVNHLRSHDVVATTTPYLESHARLTPSIYNTPEEVDAALEAIAEIA
jgi:isopenicillin-N epimerase